MCVGSIWQCIVVKPPAPDCTRALHPHNQAARERFNEFLQLAAVPADEADVERLRRERREASAKDAVAGGGGKPGGGLCHACSAEMPGGGVTGSSLDQLRPGESCADRGGLCTTTC